MSQVFEVWPNVYKALGMTSEYNFEITRLAISEKKDLWTIPIIKGVTCNKVVAGFINLGVNVYTYTDNNDLDNRIVANDRDPKNGSYAVYLKQKIEAVDKQQGCNNITLLERLLLGLDYFLATEYHLDEKNWTFCSGSHDYRGHVPGVHWNSEYRRIYVSWYNADYCFVNICSRSVVSCQPIAQEV